MIDVSREQILAFRQARQHLGERVAPDRLLEVAAMGLQSTPPTSALLAVGARLRDCAPDTLDEALYGRKDLLQFWSLRAAPYIVPTDDTPVFTTGLLPDDEASCLYLMRGAADHLRRFGMSATQSVEVTAAAVAVVLGDGSALTKDDLGVRLADHVALVLPARLRPLWDEPDGLRSNTYGQSLVRYALSVVSLRGLICVAPGEGARASRFMLTEVLLGRSVPSMAAEEARAELVRRYLRFHGPGNARGFSEWAGVAPAFARASWDLVADEVMAVAVLGRTLSLLARDAEALLTARPARGVRLLPPHDPFLAQHDKITLAPDKGLHHRIWRFVGNPGVLLVDGEVAGVWRPQKRGNRLTLNVEPFRGLSERVRALIEQEARLLGPLRGVRSVDLAY